MSSVTRQESSAAADPERAGKPDKRFGISALLTACGVMWRGAAPAFLFITVNAIVQALLTWWNPQSGLNVSFIVAFLLSLVAVLVTFAVLTRTCLDSIDGKVSLGSAIAGARLTFPQFAGWVLAQWVLISIGMLVYSGVGGLIAFLTPFLPLAAADGRKNAIGANFSAIKDRWGRWLITGIIISIGFGVWFLLTAVNTFFIKGMPASFLAWWVGGILGWWLLTAWAAIYRSTRVGADAPEAPAADPEAGKDS